MLFPTHLVAAYTLGRRWPLSPALLVLGAALPDVIDKPARAVGLFELFHTVGHSFVVLLGLAVVAYRSRRWVALWVGWASHLALDALHMLVNGRPADIQFLAWPFIRHTPAVNLPPVEFFLFYLGTPSFYAELLIWGLAGYLVVTGRRARMTDS